MIYLIKHNKFIKIGQSIDVDSRKDSLQTASPVKLQVQVILEGSFQTEKGLHEIFAHLRVRGEWFRYTDEIKWFIHAVRDNPTEKNIKTLYIISQKKRMITKAKRLGNNHKLSKKIKKICEV